MLTPLQLKTYIAVEKLLQRVRQYHSENPGKHLLGASCAPRDKDYKEDDPYIGYLSSDYYEAIREADEELNAVLYERLEAEPLTCDEKKLDKLTPDKVWVWGGPTPLWGGSMADDTLVKGADYFGSENVVYVYGPTTDHMLGLHSKYKKMLCQVNANCRTAGALANTEEENAELLSKLSLDYPNIVGAMCDDFCTSFTKILLPERFEKIYNGVKKYNKDLRVYGVIYAHELGVRNFQLIQPYIDVVNLWLWNKEEILDIDTHIARCREEFPGKPIILGIFLHEYGRSDIGNPPRLLVRELQKAREFLTKGWIEGVILLGDREIKKWPESAKAVKDYLANQ